METLIIAGFIFLLFFFSMMYCFARDLMDIRKQIDAEIEHCDRLNKALIKQNNGDLKMKTELNPIGFNAKKWREENGYTTPEWEMYANNVVCTTTILCMVCFVLGTIAERMI